MIQEHLDQLESKLQNSPGLDEATRNELLTLISTLKTEVAANLTGDGTPNQTVAPTTMEGLRSSVEHLETSHPELVQSVNRIAIILSNMGI